MLSYIYMFAPDVVGQHVLAFLNLKSLVKLDTTIMDPKQRVEFMELLRYCPPIPIHQNVQASNEELLWFKRRKCRIKEMKLSLSQSDYYDVDTSMADRVVLEVKRTIVPTDIDKLSQTSASSTITSIIMHEKQDKDLIYSLLLLMPNVKELSVYYFGDQEGGISLFESIQAAGNTFHAVKVFGNLNQAIFNFINLQGKNLKRLELLCTEQSEIDPNDIFLDIGRACPELEFLKVSNISGNTTVICDQGIIALSRSCRSLQILLIGSISVTDHVVLAIHENCLNLKFLGLDRTSFITYAALITLSKHCLPLVGLDIPWIPIPSAEVAAQCAHALSRIQRLQPTPATCTDIPSLYIGYLTSLRELYLSKDLTNENTIEVLRAVAIHCRLVETVDICARTDGIVEQLVALVSSNRRLTWLSLRQSTALTDAALIELARHCSRLTFFQMQHSPLVTDAGFLAFTMNIPNIVVIHLWDCPQLSNASVLALSEHCCQLECFTLQHCHQLTEAGLVPLVQSCRHLSTLLISRTNMSEATKSLLLSQRSEQPTIYASLYCSLR